MQEIGILPAVIDKCMNHREQNRMKRVYQRHPYTDEKREAWRLLGAQLEELTAQPAYPEKPSGIFAVDNDMLERSDAQPLGKSEAATI
jgi:hypothetical protein